MGGGMVGGMGGGMFGGGGGGRDGAGGGGGGGAGPPGSAGVYHSGSGKQPRPILNAGVPPGPGMAPHLQHLMGGGMPGGGGGPGGGPGGGGGGAQMPHMGGGGLPGTQLQGALMGGFGGLTGMTGRAAITRSLLCQSFLLCSASSHLRDTLRGVRDTTALTIVPLSAQRRHL